MPVCLAAIAVYLAVVSGVLYDVFVHPPAMGVTPAGRPEVFLAGSVSAQYIVEGMSAGLVFAIGGFGIILAEVACRPRLEQRGRALVLAAGALSVLAALGLSVAFIRQKVPSYMRLGYGKSTFANALVSPSWPPKERDKYHAALCKYVMHACSWVSPYLHPQLSESTAAVIDAVLGYEWEPDLRLPEQRDAALEVCRHPRLGDALDAAWRHEGAEGVEEDLLENAEAVLRAELVWVLSSPDGVPSPRDVLLPHIRCLTPTRMRVKSGGQYAEISCLLDSVNLLRMAGTKLGPADKLVVVMTKADLLGRLYSVPSLGLSPELPGAPPFRSFCKGKIRRLGENAIATPTEGAGPLGFAPPDCLCSVFTLIGVAEVCKLRLVNRSMRLLVDSAEQHWLNVLRKVRPQTSVEEQLQRSGIELMQFLPTECPAKRAVIAAANSYIGIVSRITSQLAAALPDCVREKAAFVAVEATDPDSVQEAFTTILQST
eukprot:m51a1_g3775 putative oligosaccharyltransferase complex subunit cg9662-like (486) ;mRNA; f:148681-150712